MREPDRAILHDVVDRVIDSGQFILRASCAELETRIAAAYGFEHAVATSSTNAGLLLVITALELGPDRAIRHDGAPADTSAILAGAGAVASSEHHSVEIVGGPSPDDTIVRGEGVPGADIRIVDIGPFAAVRGIGEAAMILTRDTEIDRRLRMLRNHGQDGRQRFLHHVVGFNARMDEISAGYLLAQFDRTPLEVRHH